MTNAAIYLRISQDRIGDGLAPARQRAECERIAELNGWTIVDHYQDTASATKRKVKREDYDRLVADYDAGKFDALICWDLDRLMRLPRELEDWIDRAEQRGLSIVTANGEADLRTDAGRLFARIKVAVAKSEIERKTARQRSKNDQTFSAGLPFAGARRFGFQVGNIKADPAEAEVVRWLFAHIASGGSVNAAAEQLGFSRARVRMTINNRAYDGFVKLRGEWTEAAPEVDRIVDTELAEQARAVISDPGRRTAPGPKHRHLLSGLAVCGECEGKLRVFRGDYRCRAESGKPQHVRMQIDRLDSRVLGAVYVWILWFHANGGDIHEPEATAGAETAPLRAKLGELRTARANVQALAEMEGADLASVARRLRELGREIAAAEIELEIALRHSAGGSLLDWLPEAIETVGDLWDGGAAFIAAFNSWPLERRRDLLRAFQITVNPGRELDRVVVLDSRGEALPELYRDSRTGELRITREPSPETTRAPAWRTAARARPIGTYG